MRLFPLHVRPTARPGDSEEARGVRVRTQNGAGAAAVRRGRGTVPARRVRWILLGAFLPLFLAVPQAHAQAPAHAPLIAAAMAEETTAQDRLLELADVVRTRNVSDLQLSPDGRTAAYVVRDMDLEGDRWRSAIWTVPVDGTAPPRRVTRSDAGERSPRWSPDGRHLAFLSGREGDGSGSQIWLLPVEGGEAFQATALDRSISSYAWSPDATRFAVSLREETEDAPPMELDGTSPPEDRPLPHVITRLQFLQDGSGYVGERNSQIHVIDFDPASAPATEEVQLTSGPYDHSGPEWSPDGRWIAFSSNRTEWPDITYQSDLWLVPSGGGDLVRLTDDPGSDGSPVWSPDGSMIAYRHTPPEPPVYGSARLRTMEIRYEGGTPRPGAIADLTDALDRPVQGGATWSADGRHVYASIQDRGTVPLLRIPARGGDVEAVLLGPSVVGQYALTPGEDRVVAILSWATQPSDVFVGPVEPRALSQEFFRTGSAQEVQAGHASLENLSRVNAEWLDQVQLSEPVHMRYESQDGTPIEGWYLLPPGASASDGPFPLILKIHGGPVAQYTWAYDFERQWWAAQGYVVVYTNPRGSSGYGEGFAHALWQDWGGPDYYDVIAGVEWLVDRDIADPDRMGVGGWSYGGILTNFIIIRDHRFSAAISGASTALNVSLYGTDDLQRWWEHELGLPWENREVYDRISALFDAHLVETPTLFVVGSADRRTPASQSEQFYTWLRRREVPTGLIVYPGEYHGISRPSFVIDRYERYRTWYARHLLGDEDADPFFGRRSW
jgi:dipeptidyl aminopeptidase/acylaminoacyl peptidase